MVFNTVAHSSNNYNYYVEFKLWLSPSFLMTFCLRSLLRFRLFGSNTTNSFERGFRALNAVTRPSGSFYHKLSGIFYLFSHSIRFPPLIAQFISCHSDDFSCNVRQLSHLFFFGRNKIWFSSWCKDFPRFFDSICWETIWQFLPKIPLVHHLMISVASCVYHRDMACLPRCPQLQLFWPHDSYTTCL